MVSVTYRPNSEKPVGFICSEVIDKRIVKDHIGFAQKGLANRRAVAKLRGDFEKVIKDVVNNAFHQVKEPAEIVFIFHDLNISERTAGLSERGICRIEIEFARRVCLLYTSPSPRDS